MEAQPGEDENDRRDGAAEQNGGRTATACGLVAHENGIDKPKEGGGGTQSGGRTEERWKRWRERETGERERVLEGKRKLTGVVVEGLADGSGWRLQE